MIEIDILADLSTLGPDEAGRGQVSQYRPPFIEPGAILVAGRPEQWSWVRLLTVDDQFVTFARVSEQEAALHARVAPNIVRPEWPSPEPLWLRVEEHGLVPLDRSTFMWVDHIQFSLEPTFDDSQLLTALTSSKLYAHGYAWPYSFGGEFDFNGRPTHGPWLAEKVTADSFARTTPGEARRTIRLWMGDDMSEAATDRVERLLARTITDGIVYHLEVPDDEEHRSDWIGVGVTGFHEFVVIDRDHGAIHLIVASDD